MPKGATIHFTVYLMNHIFQTSILIIECIELNDCVNISKRSKAANQPFCTEMSEHQSFPVSIVKANSGLFRHIQHPVQPSYVHNPLIFWALTYLKPCETLTRLIQNPAIGHYSAIFRNIQNLAQCLHTQKAGIVRILEYSKPFLNCIKTHIYPEPYHIYKNLRIFINLI